MQKEPKKIITEYIFNDIDALELEGFACASVQRSRTHTVTETIVHIHNSHAHKEGN